MISPPFGERTFTSVNPASLMNMPAGDDQGEVVDMWVEHLAIALTEYLPEVAQDFEALVVPTGSHPDVVPSPQSKRYCTE
jgi:hypothetical protein